MHAYTNFTSYDEKLSIYVHDIVNIIGRTYSELYCDTNRYVLVHTKYTA